MCYHVSMKVTPRVREEEIARLVEEGGYQLRGVSPNKELPICLMNWLVS